VANGLPRGTLPNSATNIGAGLALRLPLYQGGAASARVRVAEEARAVLVEQAILFERQAVANARAAFAVWRGSVAAIAANEAAVASSEVALRSLKIEQSVGSRNIIDVLNAQQEVLGSRIALANAERDAYVAAYTLLNTMGVAEAASLDLGVDRLYDPGANYRTYGRTWSDWADGPTYSPGSTRTVPEGASGPLSRLDGSRSATDDLRP
jgi:outer membrane protein